MASLPTGKQSLLYFLMTSNNFPQYVLQNKLVHSSPVHKSRTEPGSMWKNSPVKLENSNKLSQVFISDESKILFSSRAIICLVLWYFFSFTTLFLNKYILTYKSGDPTVLGSSQLLLCGICGYIQLHSPCGIYKYVKWEKSPPNFFKNMLLVGSLRFSTLFLGLVALWYVPVSFAETVKSSAPVFTVFLAWCLMSEKTSWLVIFSLIPVMGGLALCSANELSFNFIGFIAAMATNLSECLQNVCSKKLLSGDKYSYSPPELQFYTSIASFCVQIAALILMIDIRTFKETYTVSLVILLVVNGVSFHCQSMTEYTLLGYISPVTHSVANTVKRAFLIWLSILIFGNKVTFNGGLGTAIVIIGVFGYNKARQMSPSVVSSVKETKVVHTI